MLTCSGVRSVGLVAATVAEVSAIPRDGIPLRDSRRRVILFSEHFKHAIGDVRSGLGSAYPLCLLLQDIFSCGLLTLIGR